MAYFDFSVLRDDMASKTGYTLFSEYGDITDDLIPHRLVNEIVTPVVGIFRLNPVPLTALTTPYIGVASGSIEIPAPIEMADDIGKNLDMMAGKYNATTAKFEQDGTTFTVVYSIETCAFGERRRDVGIYNGEIIVITQAVSFTVIERGITALDVGLTIDGMPVPFLRLDETRVSTSETAPNAEGHGEMAVTQEMYGLTFDTPLVDNPLGAMLLDLLASGTGNKAHAVEVTRNGQTAVYLMGVGTANSTSTPPANVGVTLSMAELSPVAARYSDIFNKSTVEGSVVGGTFDNAAVFWGDGTASHVNGVAIHVYTDGKTLHTVYQLPFGNTQRWGGIVKGASLFRKTIRPKSNIVHSQIPTGNIIVMSSGDVLNKAANGRISMVVDGITSAVDAYIPSVNTAYLLEFVSALRGTVTEINGDFFEYDRWAVSEEV